MKSLHVIVSLVFIWFAYVQINDPDPVLWIAIYLGISLVAVLQMLGRPLFYISLVGLVLCLGGMIYLIPDFIVWVKDGMPTITGSMKAESKYIELVREFLGLTIAGCAYLLYFLAARTKNAARSVGRV